MYAITPKGIGKPVGWRSVQPGWPLADGETFVAAEDPNNKVLAEDGQSLRDCTAAEILANAKADRLAALAARRFAAETGGVTVAGMPVETGRATQAILTGARILAKENSAYAVDWKTAAGFVTLDAAAIIAAADAVAAHVQACFSNEKAIAAEIAAAADAAAVAAVDIDAGWPA